MPRPQIFIFNGAGGTEKFHFASDGFPFCRGSKKYQRFTVWPQPASENLPCGSVSISYRKGQQCVTAERLEREYLRKCDEEGWR